MKKGEADYPDRDTGLKVARGGFWYSLINLKTFTSLKNRVYRLYYGGMLGQMGAMNIEMMARSLLIYRLTKSAAILGIMSLAGALPMLFLSLFGGVIADRVQKKFVMLVGQVASAVVALGVALTLSLGYLSAERPGSWWILMVASMLQGTITGLMMPSRQAILREIVTEDELMNAISLNTMGMNALRILGPAAAGFLINAYDFEAVYYTMIGLYLIAIVFIVLLPTTSTMAIRGGGAFADIKEGLHYVRRMTPILLILVFILLTVLFSMPYSMLLPIFVEDILKVGATGMGVLMSFSGIGAISGSLAFASLPSKRRGLMLLISSLILGLALVGFSVSRSWHLSLGMIVLVGLGQTGWMTLGSTLLQHYTEDEYRGRVMSIFMMQFGLTSFSTFTAGLLAENLGVQWVVGGFAAVLVLLTALALAFVPRIRDLD